MNVIINVRTAQLCKFSVEFHLYTWSHSIKMAFLCVLLFSRLFVCTLLLDVLEVGSGVLFWEDF